MTAWTLSSRSLLVEIVFVLMDMRTRVEHVLMLMSVLTALVEKMR